MEWVDKKFAYTLPGDNPLMSSHAQMTAPFKLDENTQRIFFSSRDKSGKARPFYLDYDFSKDKVLHVETTPSLEFGERGTFDDSGIMPSSFLSHEGRVYMYYIGWNVRVSVAYHLSIGLAVSEDGGETFKKYSDGPIMDRAVDEPLFCTAPFVIFENGIFRMWYSSGTGWEDINGRIEPTYIIRYAESKDGISWQRSKNPVIPYKYDGEAIVRAWVIKEHDVYKMWYCTRGSVDYRVPGGQHYTIGYAESSDGYDWTRKDEQVGIAQSPSGWDSEMIAYPSVIDSAGKRIMLYNGNKFGTAGFGYATLKS